MANFTLILMLVTGTFTRFLTVVGPQRFGACGESTQWVDLGNCGGCGGGCISLSLKSNLASFHVWRESQTQSRVFRNGS